VTAPDRPVAGVPGIALVTGGSGALGRAISTRLAAQGYGVAIHCRQNRRGADEVAAAIAGLGGSAWTYEADLSAPDAADHIAEEGKAHTGNVLSAARYRRFRTPLRLGGRVAAPREP